MKEQNLSFMETIWLTTLPAMVSKTVAAPIERVKLLLQNQGEMIKQGRLDRSYTGLFDCVGRVARHEGLLGFWRGNLPNVIRYIPTQALNFAFKDEIKELFPTTPQSSYGAKFARNVASGGLAGMLTETIVYSLNFARTKLANDTLSDSHRRQYRGLLDVYVKTLRTDGVAGLYRGFPMSMFSVFIYRGAQFGLYDTLKPIMLGEKVDFWNSFLLGWTVTSVCGVVTYPLDTLKRRIMMTSGCDVKYSGALDCLLQIVRNEGAKALMNGAGTNVVRGLAGAGVLAGVDQCKHLYIHWRDERW